MYTVQVWMIETDIRSQKPALASNQATHTVQAVRAYAPGARRSQSCPPGWHDDSHRRSTWLPGHERLRSANSFRYETPKLKLKFGERGFSYAGPKAWNSLPANLQELTNTDTFKKQLKIYSPRCKFRFSSIENLIEVVILIH